MRDTVISTQRQAEQNPAYWFCILQRALQRGDRTRADFARARLRRLGVRVTFTKGEKDESQ